MYFGFRVRVTVCIVGRVRITVSIVGRVRITVSIVGRVRITVSIVGRVKVIARFWLGPGTQLVPTNDRQGTFRAVAFLVNSRKYGVLWFIPASKYMEGNIEQAAP